MASAAEAAECARHAYYLRLPATSQTVRLEVIAVQFEITLVALSKKASCPLPTYIPDCSPDDVAPMDPTRSER